VHEPASIINEYAVDPFLAKAALERLHVRARDALTGTAAAAGASVPLLVLGQMPVAVASFAGAVAGAVVCAYARADRTALLARLIHQRSAYQIADVARAAEALVTPQVRAQLAGTIGRLVLEADGFEPADPKLTRSYSRVREYRDEFLAVAFHLARPTSRVHPTAVAMMDRLLTHATMSPLFNERLPVTQVRTALHRVQLAIDGSPSR
jgi:hypothetical protein